MWFVFGVQSSATLMVVVAMEPRVALNTGGDAADRCGGSLHHSDASKHFLLLLDFTVQHFGEAIHLGSQFEIADFQGVEFVLSKRAHISIILLSVAVGMNM